MRKDEKFVVAPLFVIEVIIFAKPEKGQNQAAHGKSR
jgi:hypothetical protein